MRDPAVCDQEGPVYLPRRPWRLVGHMLTHGAVLIPLVLAVLFAGMSIYHFAEGLPWDDSFLDASMLLGGMGPVHQLHTRAGKILAGLYAMFAGVVFLVVAGTMLAPVVHHVLHRIHLEAKERERERES